MAPVAVPCADTSPKQPGVLSTPGHHRSISNRSKQRRMSLWLMLLLVTAGVAILTSNRSLLTAGVHDNPIQAHLDVVPVDPKQHIASERMLRMLVEECSKGEDSIIWVDPEGSMVVQSELDPQQCPVMDIMLKGTERGIGMCTDAMLYVLHLGARLIAGVDRAQYDKYCGPATARLFLETMYEEFLSSQRGVLHLQLLNAEHMWARDARLHKKMQAFLCKTELCRRLLLQHVAHHGYAASVWLMGHTSSDPSVDTHPGVARKHKASFLHVKGKSGLKHTNQLLECWSGRPDLPQLTVVGRFSWDEVKGSIHAPNIVFYPKVTEAHSDNQTEHITFSQVRAFQIENPVHICASEREGFGHYINEARAVGAFIISTDHPPMNELVTPDTGILVPPERTSSYDEMALGPYTHINAFLNASQLCGAADQVMILPVQEIERRGQLARERYLHENAVFLARLQDLKSYLERHAEAVHVTSPRSGFLQQRSRRQPWRRVLRQLSSLHRYEPG